ncbi:iron-containing alcohol dehydrogenase [Vibrio alginolyticus]|nr:iron-containing alcohol dehydrogenase [Vibrio alginolyticus]
MAFQKDEKVLFVYDGGSIKLNGVYADVIRTLEDVDINEFYDIEQHPTYETLENSVTLAKEKSISSALAVGRGRVILRQWLYMKVWLGHFS